MIGAIDWTRLGLAFLVALGGALILAIVLHRNSSQHWLKHMQRHNENRQPFWVQIRKRLQRYLSYQSKDIKQKFIQAGYYQGQYAWLYLPAKLLGAITVFVVGWFFPSLLGLETLIQKISVIAVGLVGVIIVPEMILDSRCKRLTRRISDQLPYLLDLMAVCVQTGMTIEAAISYIAKEMINFDKDLAHLLKSTDDRARVIGLNRALEELLVRVPSNEMRSFVFTLTQSLQYGSSVYGVLTTLAKDIREVQILQLEEKVGKLSSKMSVPLILFIMFPIVILIAAPGVMRMSG